MKVQKKAARDCRFFTDIISLLVQASALVEGRY